MKRAVYLLAAAWIIVLPSFWTIDVHSQQTQSYVPGEVIIKIAPAVPEDDVEAISTSLGAAVNRRFRSSGAELWTIQGMTVADAINLYKDDARVAYIEPNYIVHATQLIPNDPRFADLWGMHNTGQTGGTPDADIDAPEAWATTTGDTVIVGVIDTGVDWGHPDLAANIYTNPGEIAGNGIDDDGNGFVDDVRGWDFINNDNNPMDDNGHGTHVSGTIAGIGNNGIGVAGVNWSARIMPLKFLSSGGSGSTADAIDCVDYATMMGARLTNNSWGGGGFSQALKDAITAAGAAGYLFVAAAGNTGQDADVFPHYPAGYDNDNIISVANTTHTDGLNGGSTFGLVSVDLGAPGTNILSTLPGNNYGTASGTSMASPHVAGAVSLLWSAAPLIDHLTAKDILMTSVDPIPALSGKTVTGGRLNVNTMLQGLDSIPPDPVVDLAVIAMGSNTALLGWTATGDDSSDGTAALYDIRYSTSPIDELNFELATPVADPPQPLSSGQSETFQVGGLDFLTDYYFALRVFDEQLNGSTVSNVTSGTTLGIPALSFSPGAFADTLHTGATSTHTLTIHNVADGTLDFEFSALPAWLSTDPASGQVPAGDSAEVDFVFDATGLFTGQYPADVVLQNNDPDDPAPTIPVLLQVGSAPDIALSDDALDFGTRLIGIPALDTVLVSNIGTEFLNVAGVSVDAPQFSVDPAPFLLGLGEERALVVTFTATDLNPVAATMTITSDDPDQPSAVVALSGVGAEPPAIAVTPTSMTENLLTGETSEQTLTITNEGGTDLEFMVGSESVDGLPQAAARAAIPASTGDFPRGTSPPSIGPAPAQRPAGAPPIAPDAVVAAGQRGSAFASVNPDGSSFATRFDLNTPEVLPSVGSAFQYIWAGDFALGDNSFAYVINDINQFVRVDTLDGTETVLGSVSPFGDEIFTGMAVDPTDGTLYATSTNIGSSSLYLIDPGAVTATRIGPIGFGGVIAVAVDDEGVMFAHDIVSDELLSIDKTTGAGTVIGSLGFDANFGQGMAFDAESGELYLAAFNNATFVGELRIADRTTGATALVGVLGATTPGGVVQLGWMALPVTGVPWLSLEPASGVLPPGEFMDVTVTFDAAGLEGGGYDGNIVVVSNDPDDATVTVPAHLDVTGVADIVLSHDAIDFGEVFVGSGPTETLVVTNGGVELLTVTGISSDNGDYSVDVTSFSLTPGQSRDVVVTFAPASTGPSPGTLTVASDDPDEPTVTVALSGEGVEPPRIAVTPSSLSESLLTGETSTQVLTIDNSAGGTDLVWESHVEVVTTAAAAVQTYTLSAPQPGGEDPDGGKVATAVRTAPLEATLVDLTGVRILYDQAHGQSSLLSWSLIIADLTSRGAVVDANTAVITPALLADYDVFWTTDIYAEFSPSELSALTSWVLGSGGGLILEGDNTTTVPIYNSVLSALGAGIEYNTIDGASGTTSNIYPHETTEGVAQIYLSANIAHLATVVSPAGKLVDDINNVPNSAYSEVGGGRIVAMADEVMINSRMGTADNQLFANQVFDWAASGVRWLALTPDAGTVAAGASADVTVTFDAARLGGGGYDANVLVMSNDPDDDEVVVPAHLDVTAAPDITLSEAALDYGLVFVGTPVTDTLVVTNDGTQLLVVSDISADNGDYTVDVTAFGLNPGESQLVEVTFSPAVTGPSAGTLTIVSNDPDEPAATVALSGEGVDPPVMTVSPSALSDTLATGEIATHLLTISNSGGSELEFDIGVLDDTGAAVTDKQGDDDPRVRWSSRPEFQGSGDSRAAHEREPIAPMQATAPSSGDAILVIQDFSAWGLSMVDFIASEFGIAATQINSSQIATTNFAAFDLIITTGDQSSSYYNAVSANAAKFESFVAAGGFVQYQLATQGDNVDLAGGVDVIFGQLDNVNLNVLPSHPIVAGLPINLEGNSANHCYLTNLPGSAKIITTTSSSGLPTTVEYKYGFGTVVATGMTWEFLFPRGYNSGPMLYNAVAYALQGAGLWLSADPTSGVVPAGGSVDVTVTFDASGLEGGAYDAALLVTGNDPDNDTDAIPAHLEVIGAPDIALSDSELDFGVAFVGVGVRDTVTVTNEGVVPLVVTSASTDNPDYTTDPAGTMTLNPGESRDVEVTFMPASSGPSTGVLTFASNDPDEPSATVALSGEGIDPPVIAVTPSSVADSLVTGEMSTQTLTIGNSGSGDLSFEIGVQDVPGGPVAVYAATSERFARRLSDGGGDGTVSGGVELIEVAKGQEDPRVYPPMTLSGGGPDPFGYKWKDSDEPGGPNFDWIDVSGGTPIFLSDDDFETGIPLGFTFTYYGNDYTHVGVGSNGWLSFNGASAWYPSNVPAIDGYLGAIAPFARDLYPPTANYIRYRTFGTAPNRRFVVEYNDIPNFAGTNEKTFEVIFYEGSNKIRFQYLIAPDLPSGFGIESPDETMGMGNAGVGDLFISPGLIENQYAIEFSLAPDWIEPDPLLGVVPPGQTFDVVLRFNAQELPGGDYDASLLVASNDPLTPEVTVPAHLRVTGAPDIALSETALDFGTVFVGASPKDTVVVMNAGVEPLAVSDITSDNGDYSVDATAFVVNAGDSREVEVTFSPAGVGPSAGTLTVVSNDPDEPAVVVALSGAAVEPPVMSVSPLSLSDSLFTGQRGLHLVTVANRGASDLEFTASVVNAEGPVASSANVVVIPSKETARAVANSRIEDEARIATTDYPDDVGINAMKDVGGAAYMFEYVSAMSSLSILYFSDLNFFSQRVGEQALVNLGVSYTMYVDDYTGFVSDLTSGEWDVVIFESGANVWDIAPLMAHVASGGRLITSYWRYDAVFAAGMEANYVSSLPSPLLVSQWSGHAIFNTPNDLPDLEPGPDDSWNDNGDRFDPAGSALALAGYTSSPSGGQSAIVLGNSGNTLLNGFIFEDYLPLDNDGDSKPDVVELVENEILFLGSTWLIVEPSAAVVPPTVEYNIQATFNAAGLVGGDYTADVVISGNDPINPEVTIPAALHVTGVPDIVVVEPSLDFGDVFIGDARELSLTILNIGTDDLIVSDVQVDMPEYSVVPNGFTLPIGDTATVMVTFSPSAVGPRPSRLSVLSNDFDEPRVVVPLSGRGVAPPVCEVTPAGLIEDLVTGATATQQIKIDNADGATHLDWDISILNATVAAAVSTKRSRCTPTPPVIDHRDGYEAYDAADAGSSPSGGTAMPATDSEVIAFNQALLSTLAQGVVVFFDDMESGVNGWTHYATSGGVDLWAQSTARSNSGATSWNAAQHSSFGADALQSPSVDLSAYTGATLVFSHWYNFDDCEDSTFEPDGGIVEVTVDGGATWQKISPVDGYPYVLDDVCDNPLAFEEAYSHDGGDGALFIPAIFDLTPFAGNEIAIRFHAGWDCGNCSSNEGWYIDDVTVFSEGIQWLSVEPASGIVAPGGYQVVDVLFDAASVVGGDHAAEIVVASNDPLNPEVVVPVNLHVTGAPDITVSTTALEFDPLFVGLDATKTLMVINQGTDQLVVTAVTSDHADFSATPTAFNLGVGEAQEVSVTFAPSSAGAKAGTLTITSNDPDEGTVAVALAGTGVAPPVIVVSPDSLGESLLPGETSAQTMTIDNSAGGTDLEWSSGVVETTGDLLTYELPAAKQGDELAGGVVIEEDVEVSAVTSTFRDLTGVRMLYDEAHGEPSLFNYSLLFSDLVIRGATFNINTQPITDALLVPFDVLWCTEISSSWSQAEIAAVANWVAGGGGLVLMGTGNSMVSAANDILTATGAGIQYSIVAGTPGTTTNIFPHATTVDVSSLVLTANGAHLSTVTSPAGLLVNDAAGVPNSAYSVTGAGRMVAIAADMFLNSRIGGGYNRVFGNRVFDWVSAGVGWLSVAPATGTVPAGASVDVTVTFDASNVIAGDYSADILILSNDPSTPLVVVPATLTVGSGSPVSSASKIPVQFALHDNFPNPFNPTTTIRFDVPTAVDVILEIYNVKGQRVRTLVSGVQPAGSYAVEWDGRSANGNTVATGVYFYRLRAGDFVRTKKMVMIK